MTGTQAGHGDSVLERYLDDLLVALRGHPRQIRYQMAEAEAHLRDATAEGVARGLGEPEAEAEAVARFGPVRALAVAEAQRRRRSTPEVVRDCLVSGWWLGALGALAVGVSGFFAALTTRVWGQTFMAGLPSASVLTPSACARWRANTGISSCARAATADWAHDTVIFRLAFGVLGVLGLGVWLTWRSLGHGRASSARAAGGLPAAITDTVALTVFGTAGVWLAGQTIDTIVVAAGRGAGQWLSAAPVALAIAAVFAARLMRDIQAPDAGKSGARS